MPELDSKVINAVSHMKSTGMTDIEIAEALGTTVSFVVEIVSGLNKQSDYMRSKTRDEFMGEQLRSLYALEKRIIQLLDSSETPVEERVKLMKHYMQVRKQIQNFMEDTGIFKSSTRTEKKKIVQWTVALKRALETVLFQGHISESETDGSVFGSLQDPTPLDGPVTQGLQAISTTSPPGKIIDLEDFGDNDELDPDAD